MYQKYIKCLKREKSFRERVYPNLVARGKMTQFKATQEIELMNEMILHFQELQENITPKQKGLFND